MDERCWVVGPDGRRLAVGRPAPGRVLLTPATVLTAVLQQGWEQYTLVHTHPADAPPSPADHALTRRLIAAGAVIGVTMTAHLVEGPGSTWIVTGDRRAA